MKQDDPQFKLRMPPNLKERLESKAKTNSRTLGAEIVARLEGSFEDGLNEFVQLERYKSEALLRIRLEANRMHVGVMAASFVELHNWIEEGMPNDEGQVQKFAELSTSALELIDSALRNAPEKIIEQYRAVEARYEELKPQFATPGSYAAVRRGDRVRVPTKKPSKPAAKKA